MKVSKRGLRNIVLALLSVVGIDAAETAPHLVYGTYLGGRDKECATSIAVDRSGEAYVVGRTPSPDFPVTPHAFSTKTQVNNNDWTGFVSKISEGGDQLLYSSFLGGNFRSSANAIAVDSAGRAVVVGSTCSSNFPTTRSAVLQKAAGSDKVDACDGFLALLNPEGSQLEYGTYLGGSREDAATAVAFARSSNVVYVAGYTFSPDFPVTGTAFQPKLNGVSNGFLSAIDIGSGKLLYSTYLGGTGHDRITALAVASNGAVYASGITDSQSWPNLPLRRFGTTGATDGFAVRLDPTGKEPPYGMRIGGSGDESLTSMALDSDGDIYVVGSTASPNFPLAGANLKQIGSGFIMKINGRKFAGKQSGVMWSRRLGGHGDDALSSVSAAMPRFIFVSGRSGSKDFPTTKTAIYSRLEAENDSILIQLRVSDGQVRFATFVGGTRHPDASWYNDEATGVLANANGDVYVTGCTLDDRLPVSRGALQLRPKGNSEPFVLRMKFQPSE
jgi:beta-propeller repeat-containing protein